MTNTPNNKLPQIQSEILQNKEKHLKIKTNAGGSKAR
jgi:hypothetical protein